MSDPGPGYAQWLAENLQVVREFWRWWLEDGGHDPNEPIIFPEGSVRARMQAVVATIPPGLVVDVHRKASPAEEARLDVSAP
jgi:hypothetical protein